MELWIRSQDKEKLVLAKGFEILPANYDNSFKIFAVWENNYQMIGKYTTRRRTLEVLDEIFEILKGTKILEILNENNGNMDNLFPILTYEMPKE